MKIIMLKASNKLLKCLNVVRKIQSRSIKDKVSLMINGKTVTVPRYYSIIQALRDNNVTVPSFCYHERLTIAGNCRMCLVEVEGWPKLQIACATPVAKNMRIRTNSEFVLRAQESVLEFILADHPLDCPICDQGGECDLQDLSYKFGSDRSRFTEIHFHGKRAVESKNLGPLIRTEMNRCIHCTRCIRFGAQICGVEVLGTTGRGHGMLVGTYVDKMFLSELSGNIIDLCPVGSLTSKPYMFKARPWELKRTNSIDVTDATGTNIVACSRFDRVLRMLPRENEEINQEWLSDKGRFAIDSLEMQRLVTPMANIGGGCLSPVDWDWAMKSAAAMICPTPPANIMAVAGPHTTAETLVVAKDLLNALGSEETYIERNLCLPSGIDIRAGYLMSISMQDVAKADKIILIGTNPRFEAPILNMWIRQAYTTNECDIYVIGPKCEYNYHVDYLGSDLSALNNIYDILEKAKKPLIFIGVSQLGDVQIAPILMGLYECTARFRKKECILNVIPREASYAAALEAGWRPGGIERLKACSPDVLIVLGADELFYKWCPPPTCTIIYIGFQGDKGSQYSTLIMPGSAYTESGGTYLNMEGRAQVAQPAVTPPGLARYDWKIIRALAEYLGICLWYDDTSTLQSRMEQISPNFVKLNEYQPKILLESLERMASKSAHTTYSGCVDVELKTLRNYYCSDVFTYNSPTMVQTWKAACEYLQKSYAKN